MPELGDLLAIGFLVAVVALSLLVFAIDVFDRDDTRGSGEQR